MKGDRILSSELTIQGKAVNSIQADDRADKGT